MMGSTKLSAETQDRSTAGAYQLYTGTAVRLFHAFEVRGDGAFALFNRDQTYRALAAAVTFKTFAREIFVPRIKELTGIEAGSHIGIDRKTVLVRRIGLRRAQGRTDRQNEVWAGKPVNMAAKLASMTEHDELLASERFFRNLKDERALKTCGCPDGIKEDLWTEKDLSEDSRFDFDKAYSLRSQWCSKHGKEYCEAILALD
jgi:class 3 adenylate cyclase